MKTHPKKQKSATFWRFILIFSALGVLLASLGLMGMQANAAPPPPLPPVPTATATPSPTPTPGPTLPRGPTAPAAPFSGAFIKLHVRFPQAWPWDKANWQKLHTIVQWQDPNGSWHDVAGWRGTLDNVEPTADGHMVGSKVWWLAAENFGTGAFRWQVHRDQAGPLLTTSEVFYLPTTMRRTLVIEVTLSPSALIDENIHTPDLPEREVFLRANRRSD